MNRENYLEVYKILAFEGKILSPELVKDSMKLWEKWDTELGELASKLCERNLTTQEKARVTVLRRKVTFLFKDLGFEVEFGQDPRGYISKFFSKSGTSNSFGGEGKVGINWR